MAAYSPGRSRLFAPGRRLLSATRTAARIGTGFAVGFAILAVLSLSPIMFLLALFVYGAASGESRTVALGTPTQTPTR